MPTGYSFRSSVLRYLCPQKVPLLKISDDVIACDLWFGPPQSKILATSITISLFYERNVIIRVNLPNGAVPGPRVLNDGKTF